MGNNQKAVNWQMEFDRLSLDDDQQAPAQNHNDLDDEGAYMDFTHTIQLNYANSTNETQEYEYQPQQNHHQKQYPQNNQQSNPNLMNDTQEYSLQDNYYHENHLQNNYQPVYQYQERQVQIDGDNSHFFTHQNQQPFWDNSSNHQITHPHQTQVFNHSPAFNGNQTSSKKRPPEYSAEKWCSSKNTVNGFNLRSNPFHFFEPDEEDES